MQFSHILLLTVAMVLLASVQAGNSSPVPKSTTDLTTTTETAGPAADLEIKQLANLPMTNSRSARKWSSWASASSGLNSMRRRKLLNLHRG